MPHVIVKMLSGRSDEQKERLASEIEAAVVRALGSAESSISVAVEDIASSDWTEGVYKSDILAKADTVIRKPGYKPF